MELERRSSLKELERLRQSYEQVQRDLTEQRRLMQSIEKAHAEQDDKSTRQQLEYLSQINDLFRRLRYPKETASRDQRGVSYRTLKEVRSQLDEQIHFFSSVDPSSLIDQRRRTSDASVTNDLSSVISRFHDLFSRLFDKNSDPSDLSSIEHRESDQPVLNILHLLLSDIYEETNKLRLENRDLHEELIYLQGKLRLQEQWLSKIGQSIADYQCSRSDLKAFAAQMISECQGKQQLIDSQSVGKSAASSEFHSVRIPFDALVSYRSSLCLV